MPPEPDAAFVYAMEDVREVYHRPFDGNRPLVCRDEASKPLIGGTVPPSPAEPGQPERFDFEYVRNGTANLFMISAPLLGWRAVPVTPRRAGRRGRGALAGRGGASRRGENRAGDGYPEHAQAGVAGQGVPAGPGVTDCHAVGDSSHAQARFVAEHGRNRVERVESSVSGPADRGEERDAARDCGERLRREIAAREVERNERPIETRGQFTTPNARVKLHRLYPAIQ